MNDKPFNRAAVALQLSEAKLALETALERTKSGAYDNESPVVMAIDFQHVLYKLCLAWHFKHMTDEELSRQSQEEFERLSNTVPNFGFELTLMAGIDPEVPTQADEGP
jgi:hypothetical protein